MLSNFNRALELSDRLNTNYLRILYYEFSHSFADHYKSYEYARLCTILEGEIQVEADRAAFLCNAGRFLLLPPQSTVHMAIRGPVKAGVVELKDSLLNTVREKAGLDGGANAEHSKREFPFCRPKSRELGKVLQEINGLILQKSRNSRYLLDLYAQLLVYHLFQIRGVCQLLEAKSANPVNLAIGRMKRDYMQSISIKQISSELEMSEAGFSQ